MGNSDETADLYEKAANSWSINGEVEKAGDCIIKAAKEVKYNIYIFYVFFITENNMNVFYKCLL